MLSADAFFFNPYSIPNVLVSTLIFAAGLFVYLQNRSSVTHLVFFLFCLSLNLWLYGRAFMYSSKEPETALWIGRWIAFFGVAHIAPLVFTFSVLWLHRYERQKYLVWFAFLAAPVLYVLTVLTPYGMPSVRRYFWGYYPVYGPVCKVYLGFFFFYFSAAFINFFSELKIVQDPVRKKQVQLITLAFLISFAASLDYLPKIIDFGLYPFGYLMVLVWTLIVSYAIVKYRALDIQTVIHKTLLWLGTSLFFVAPIVLLFSFSRDWLLALHPAAFLGVVSVLFLAFALYARHVQPQIDHFFQRRQWDLNRELERFTDSLVHLKDLNEVIHHLLNTVKYVFYASNTSVLVRKGNSSRFTLFQRQTVQEDLSYEMDETFLTWLEADDGIVIADFVTLDPRFAKVRELAESYLQQMQALLCVPLIANRKLIGILNIGQKENLRDFQAPEIAFLSDLRRTAAIAVSNSLQLIAIQENLRRWNEELEKKVDERTKQLQLTQAQLFQAEKLATIGTLAGGVAHEINNPLTAVLTNAQILKMAANEEDLESISLIEEGAKRCQAIIQNLLKYARKSASETPHTEVHPNQVIQSACNFLMYQLRQENIDLVYDLKEVSPIAGVANEIEQILTNLLVNARDAIRNANRPGKIILRSREQKGSVLIEVEDNGTGMPEKVQNKIFDPFFTTKDVGGGTGLGLAVSHSILQKHQGEVRLRSEVGKGTVFILTFPAMKAQAATA